MPIINSVCEIVWFKNNGLSKMLFFNFFKWHIQISNDYCQNLMAKPSFFIVEFEGSYEVLLRHKYFWSTYFDNETTALLKFFEISTEMHFVSIFFLQKRNITTSLLMIHLKCTVVDYVNLNSSSINRPYLKAVKYIISFFSISYLCLY